MCDFEDFYYQMAEELPDGCVIAEVGVADGYSALYLAEQLRSRGKDFTLYMIDSLDYGGKDQLNTIIHHVMASGLRGISIMPFSSLDASCKFPDNHFDMVFIDASHKYEETKADIRLWYHKVKELGILAGHDYYMPEVRKAVDEVIPVTYTRPPIPNGEHPPYEKAEVYFQELFKPEQCLHINETAKNLGVWEVRKKFYLKMS